MGRVPTKRLTRPPSPNSRRRNQLAPFALDDLKIGQFQEPDNVASGEPVLRPLGHAPVKEVENLEDRLPPPAVIGDDDTGLRRAQPMQVGQRGLNVLQRADGVGQHDYVERPLQGVQNRRVLHVASDERQFGMIAARHLDHGLADVHAHSVPGLQANQQLTRGATELEHAQALGYQKLHEAPVVFVVKGVAGDPSVPLRGQPVKMVAKGGLSVRQGRRLPGVGLGLPWGRRRGHRSVARPAAGHTGRMPRVHPRARPAPTGMVIQ